MVHPDAAIGIMDMLREEREADERRLALSPLEFMEELDRMNMWYEETLKTSALYYCLTRNRLGEGFWRPGLSQVRRLFQITATSWVEFLPQYHQLRGLIFQDSTKAKADWGEWS